MLMEVFPWFSDGFFLGNSRPPSGNILCEAWIPPARCPLWRRDELGPLGSGDHPASRNFSHSFGSYGIDGPLSLRTLTLT